MCDQPARNWTVASLAAEVHTSRATLASRFTLLVGQPPMAFLAAVRPERAAEILRESGCATMGFIARQVGYGNSFALSVAFKPRYGLPPSDYRKAFQRVSRTPFSPAPFISPAGTGAPLCTGSAGSKAPAPHQEERIPPYAAPRYSKPETGMSFGSSAAGVSR
ncbi:helix-turn-helix domain-containing protein [Nocardia sp. NPDC056000]|uniref:helix-turn-helix domain-containing protein n=1 Tax=Nocardia sp. NPDC056000 TaxID=3345674 RepID=UPI0035DAA54D